MNITQLAAKPALVKITLDSPEILADYSEPVEFWIWDRQPMAVFVKMSQINAENFIEVVNLMREVVLTDTGTPALTADTELPPAIWMSVTQAVVSHLGNPPSQTTPG